MEIVNSAPVNKYAGLKVFLGIPQGDDWVHNGVVLAMDSLKHNDFPAYFSPYTCSSLTHNFNTLWCEALNARETDGITHFAMLHSDVVPVAPTYLQDLMDILIERQWSVVSAIIPIKGSQGLTSTGFDTHRWRPRRLVMKEAHKLPPTWGLHAEDIAEHGDPRTKLEGDTSGALLINTGLFLADIRQPWVDKVCFEFRNRIIKHNGKYLADFEPEDWRFSRQLNAAGVRYGVTRAVGVEHCGNMRFGTTKPWGSFESDTINRPITEQWHMDREDGGYPDNKQVGGVITKDGKVVQKA